jgi:hypothetical protein
MDECERSPGDVADLAGAGGDVLKGARAAGEQRESAFAQAAQGAEQRVASTGIDIEVTPVRGLPDRDVHADASAVVSRIGQGGQCRSGGPVQVTLKRRGVSRAIDQVVVPSLNRYRVWV